MYIDTLFMFSHIVETGSMTKAAQHLHISQSALTQQVKTLERRVGLQLLDRSNKGVHPTPAGEAVYRAALDINEIYQRMEQELEALRQDKQVLRIAATHMVYTYALPCTLFDLKRQFSSFRLETLALSSHQIERKVNGGQVDIGIIISPPQDPELYRSLVFTDRLSLVVRWDSPCPASLTPDMLQNQPLLMLDRTHHSRRLLDQYLEEMGLSVDKLDIPHSFDSIETIRQAAFNGFGMAFLPYSAIKKDLFNRQLRTVSLDGFALEHEYYIIARKNQVSENKDLARLLSYLEKTLPDTIC